MSANYALSAAERMVEALEQPDEQIRGPALAAALRIGCHTLHRLVRDCQPGFPLYEDLRTLIEREKENDNNYKIQQCLDNVEEFLNTFVFMEKSALIQAGASPRLVRYLFSDIKRIATKISDKDLRPETVQHRLGDLENSVCEAERQVRKYPVGSDGGMVPYGVLGVGGGGLVILNASTDAVTTLGLLPWMTALSGSLGSALIGVAIGEVF